MGFRWSRRGGFEERLLGAIGHSANSDMPDPQRAETFEDISERACSLPQETRYSFSTREEAPREMALLNGQERSFAPLQTETENSGSPNSNGESEAEGGLVRYDPDRGIWVRAEQAPSSHNGEILSGGRPFRPAAARAGDRPQQKLNRNSGSIIRFSSWLRTEAEDDRGFVTLSPEETREAELQRLAPHCGASEVFSSKGDQTSEVAGSLITPGAEDPPVPAPSSEPDGSAGAAMAKTETDAEQITSGFGRPAEDVSNSLRDGNTPRWFVLDGLLGGNPAPDETLNEALAPVPVLEVFSLASGVGKTSLVATLGRMLSARGERVLMVEAAHFASLGYFFGACGNRQGLRTFSPPAWSSDTPIRMITVDPEAEVMKSSALDSLAEHIQEWASGVSRVIVDVATASIATLRKLSPMSPVVLVPLIPDVQSVVTTNSISTLFQRAGAAIGQNPITYYVLNQFDPSLPLHVEVRKILTEKLGDHLLPFALPKTPAVGEALAQGMTIMDYAPDSLDAEEFTRLSRWLEHIVPPAVVSTSGRWRER